MACIAAGENVGKRARALGVSVVDMYISGYHKNKRAALKGLLKSGLQVASIKDATPIPFNGCKPKKPRRL
jgi:small subunit ribosomal protein S11